MEDKRLHLKLIQNIISRMASNLFFLRGWTITLIVALFAFLAKEANGKYIAVVYFPVFIFWILDGYFLSQERLYRALYDHVRKLDVKKIDFSMDTTEFKRNKGCSWLASISSPTILMFYIPLLVIMLIITYFLFK